MKHIAQLSKIDLNLLTVFHALTHTKSVTLGARTLNISQPAMSHALSRLRETLGDPLFVRSSKEMVPTPRAMQLMPVVDDILSRIEAGLLKTEQFSPSRLQRRFHIKTTDFLEALTLPRLLKRMSDEAPHVSLSVTSPEFQLPRVKLEDGRCDLAIGGFFGDLPDGFYQQQLFVDTFQSVVRSGHPRLKGKKQVTIDQFCQEHHALIAPSGDLQSAIDKLLRAKKKSRVITVGLSSFVSSGWTVEGSDMVLTAPSRLIQLLLPRFDLHAFPLPIKAPSIALTQVWHERNHQDQAHKWFRHLVRDVLQESPSS